MQSIFQLLRRRTAQNQLNWGMRYIYFRVLFQKGLVIIILLYHSSVTMQYSSSSNLLSSKSN